MKVDVNKPVELVTYDCGHEISVKPAEILSVDNVTAFVKVNAVDYHVVDLVGGGVRSDHRIKLRNKKVIQRTENVFLEVFKEWVEYGGNCRDLWKDLVEKGVVEDTEIEV